MMALGTSMIAYNGELSQYNTFSAMFHGKLIQTRNRWLNPAVEFGGGKLTANNVRYTSETGTPNRSFNTSFFHLSAQLQLNLIKKPHQCLYLSQGIGMMRFSPQDDRNNALLKRPETRANEETYSNFALLLPTAIGGTYQFPNHWGIGMEVGLLNTRTDYLDNISLLGDPSTKDNVLRIQFAVIAPLSYDLPERNAERKERLAKRREEIRLKNQREKEEFERLKKAKSKTNTTQKPTQKVPAKKKPIKKAPNKTQQRKKPKLFGIF
ncbi:MAG: hypothetical protein RMJ87_13685 [Cytophagales bacterium]|nr:hypothetical protein [Bernardetiaceae bacterium]MDW8206074.1 hypothetical protein [Cytophagales bacterium]